MKCGINGIGKISTARASYSFGSHQRIVLYHVLFDSFRGYDEELKASTVC
jgi:hypothetical protein